MDEAENALIEARAKKQVIEQDKITADNIYKALIYFDKLYKQMSEAERHKIMTELVEEIQIYEERQPNGQWLKSIKFRLPLMDGKYDLSLDGDTQDETVVLMSRVEGK